jgi:hypothetical protein
MNPTTNHLAVNPTLRSEAGEYLCIEINSQSRLLNLDVGQAIFQEPNEIAACTDTQYSPGTSKEPLSGLSQSDLQAITFLLGCNCNCDTASCEA